MKKLHAIAAYIILGMMSYALAVGLIGLCIYIGRQFDIIPGLS